MNIDKNEDTYIEQDDTPYMTISKYSDHLQTNQPPMFDQPIMMIIRNIITSIQDAERGRSGIDPDTPMGSSLLNLAGMTGKRT